MRLALDIRAAARALDTTMPIPQFQSLEEVLPESISNRRVRALPAVGFGVLALSVAFLGVLATISTLVAERRRDLAIRSALGASPARITWTILARGLGLTTLGIVLGLGLGTAAARSLSALLYGVSPYDLTTFAATALLIAGGATLMTYVAARRARRVEPIAVLRNE